MPTSHHPEPPSPTSRDPKPVSSDADADGIPEAPADPADHRADDLDPQQPMNSA